MRGCILFMHIGLFKPVARSCENQFTCAHLKCISRINVLSKVTPIHSDIFRPNSLIFHPLIPVSTQENKNRIGLDFFPSSLIHTARPKKVENTSTLYHPGCGSQVQTGTENWYRKLMRGINFVPIRSDPMLIFLSGNRPLHVM